MFGTTLQAAPQATPCAAEPNAPLPRLPLRFVGESTENPTERRVEAESELKNVASCHSTSSCGANNWSCVEAGDDDTEGAQREGRRWSARVGRVGGDAPARRSVGGAEVESITIVGAQGPVRRRG